MKTLLILFSLLFSVPALATDFYTWPDGSVHPAQPKQCYLVGANGVAVPVTYLGAMQFDWFHGRSVLIKWRVGTVQRVEASAVSCI